MDIYEYDELLVGYISVCSSGLFGRVLLILTDTTHSLSGENKLFIAILTQLEGFFSLFDSYRTLPFRPRPNRAQLSMERLLSCSPPLSLILTTPFSLPCVMWHFPCYLSIAPSLSAALFSFSSCPIPLSSPFHPDVNAFIMWSTCTSCWSLSPSPFLPLPLSMATVTDPCVCVCARVRARREHTGCHRANICQGDLACQSWRARVCLRCQGRHAAVCGDKGLFPWFLLSSCHPLSFCSHCSLYPFSP